MKTYPSIPYPDECVIGEPCYAFYKYDGSNLRFEWSRKKGWYKFGTRTRLFDETDPDYGCAIDIFHNDLAISIDRILRNKYNKHDSAIVFAEFFGPNSFAGQHVDTDHKQLVLFDVNIHKKGILSPKQFVKDFGTLNIADIVYQGPFTEDFVDDVYNGKYDLNEGIIAKGGEGHDLWMRKVKTEAYKEKLKLLYAGNWNQYW